MAGTTLTTAGSYIESMQLVLDRVEPSRIDAFADLLFDVWHRGHRVFVFGNGGSGYTASHYTLDLVKTAAVDGQKRLQCFSLVDNSGLTTALANDVHYDETFVYPLATHARAGDLAVAISCSGNSPNVVKACAWAKANDLTLVCLSGFSGGRMAAYADLHINVPHDNYGLIEDLHLAVGHMVTQQLRARIQAETGR
jgi:D-sedoheptulose 7-phosphate isomerase